MALGMRKQKLIKNIVFYFFLILIICVLDFPIYWMIKCSFTDVDQIMTRDVSLAMTELDPSAYAQVWTGTGFASQLQFKAYMANSFIVVLVSSGISIVLATLAGYSLARFRYKHRNGIAQVILYVYMFPQMLLTTPLLTLVIKMGLYNSLWSLIIVYCTFSLPYSIWMMRSYFLDIPYDLEQSALIDGCTYFQAFSKIVFPLAGPGIATTAIFSFNYSWNEFLYALILTGSRTKTLPLGVYNWVSYESIDYGGLTATAILALIPIVIFYCFVQKGLVRGMTMGAVKG